MGIEASMGIEVSMERSTGASMSLRDSRSAMSGRFCGSNGHS